MSIICKIGEVVLHSLVSSDRGIYGAFKFPYCNASKLNPEKYGCLRIVAALPRAAGFGFNSYSSNRLEGNPLTNHAG